MKAVTVWPEWAWAIMHLDKVHENRGWQPHEREIGKVIALHAGKTFGGSDGDAFDAWCAVGDMASRAGWDHEVEKLDGGDVRARFWRDDESHGFASLREVPTSAFVGAVTLAGPAVPGARVAWGVPGQWAWPLTARRVLRHPIPSGGRLSLWPVPEGVDTAILNAPAVSRPDPVRRSVSA